MLQCCPSCEKWDCFHGVYLVSWELSVLSRVYLRVYERYYFGRENDLTPGNPPRFNIQQLFYQTSKGQKIFLCKSRGCALFSIMFSQNVLDNLQIFRAYLRFMVILNYMDSKERQLSNSKLGYICLFYFVFLIGQKSVCHFSE